MRNTSISLRRNFLVQGTAALAGASFLQMASADAAEIEDPAVQMKSERFIDTHVHLWTNDLQKYPLSAGYTREMKPAAFLPADILRHAHRSGVNRIVLVQMSYYGFDNTFMLDTMLFEPTNCSGHNGLLLRVAYNLPEGILRIQHRENLETIDRSDRKESSS